MNGWSNWETWQFGLQFAGSIDEHIKDGDYATKEELLDYLNNFCEDYLEIYQLNADSFAGFLLCQFFDQVNFEELADAHWPEEEVEK